MGPPEISLRSKAAPQGCPYAAAISRNTVAAVMVRRPGVMSNPPLQGMIPAKPCAAIARNSCALTGRIDTNSKRPRHSIERSTAPVAFALKRLQTRPRFVPARPCSTRYLPFSFAPSFIHTHVTTEILQMNANPLGGWLDIIKRLCRPQD